MRPSGWRPSSLEDLGAGFALATHDLEIRGAGELLGDDQSGQIESVGFTLYMEMLEQAVEALKHGKEPSLEQLMSQHTEVELRLPALLPDDYIPDVNMRLSMYKRIASAADEQELRELKVELIDRFGLLPEPTKTLMELAAFRQRATALGIRRVEMSERGGYLDFTQETRVNPAYLVKLLSSSRASTRWTDRPGCASRCRPRTGPCASNWWTACWRISPAMPPPEGKHDVSRARPAAYNNGSPRAPVSLLARGGISPPARLLAPDASVRPPGSTVLPPNPSTDTMH